MASEMVVQTVCGPIPPADMGTTLSHEHLVFDARWFYQDPPDVGDQAYASRPVSIEMLGWLAFNPESNYDNLVLDDESLLVDELSLYRRAGGRTLVDCTVTGLGRDPAALVRLSQRSGINVLMGSGFYVRQSHPAWLSSMSAETVAELIVSDFRGGADGTGVRAGFIGEIASSWPMEEDEAKVFRAAGIAQSILGCALSVHPGRHPDSPTLILDMLRESGADLGKVILGHIERTVQDARTLASLAEQGCLLMFDGFGNQVTGTLYRRAGRIVLSDAQRIGLISALADAGYGAHLLMSHDICTKHRLRRYGGIGYDHLLTNVIPWMRQRGLDADLIEALTVENPRRAFAMPTLGSPESPSPTASSVPRSG